MSDNTKRTGEARSGIDIQMRFVSAKRTHDSMKREVKISVRCDETKKGSPDNFLRVISKNLPQLAHLGGHGEAFLNKPIQTSNRHLRL